MANRPSRPRSVPHLRLNRCGVWCFRLTVCGRAVQRSLGTKDKALANMLASRLTKRGNEPTVSDIIKTTEASKTAVFRRAASIPAQDLANASPSA